MKKALALQFIVVASLLRAATESGGILSDNQKAMDVSYQKIDIKVDPYRKIITGVVEITFSLFQKTDQIEIDLKKGYVVSGASINGMSLSFEHQENKILIENPDIGLFSEDFFFGQEEWDLSIRLLKRGYYIYYDPNFSSLHAVGGVFLKGNQKTGNVFIRSESGLGEGILLTCQYDHESIESSTFGPLPLDFFTN